MQSVFHRRYCNLEHESLYSGSLLGTKHLIEEFYSTVTEQLNFIASTPFDNFDAAAKLRFFER